MGALIRTANQFKNSDFPTPRGYMLRGPWVLGNDYGIADMYLFTLSQWLAGDGVDIATMPKLADHFRRVGERPAVKRAIAAELG